MNFFDKKKYFWSCIIVVGLVLLIGVGERWVQPHAKVNPDELPSFSDRNNQGQNSKSNSRQRLKKLIVRLNKTEGDTKSEVLTRTVNQLAELHGIDFEKEQHSGDDESVSHTKGN